MNKLRVYLEEYARLKSIAALLHWDMETMMPRGAVADRAKQLSYVQGKLHSLITNRKYEALLREFGEQDLNPSEKILHLELLWDYELQKALPLKHVLALSEAQTEATHVWARARQENDWESFWPHLQRLIDLKRQETKFFQVKRPYDALLRLHDREFDTDRVARIFQELKLGLRELTAQVSEEGRFTAVKELKGPFKVKRQQKLNVWVSQALGLPEKFSRLDVSTHPFSINISPLDQRITTRYDERHLDSFFSTIHEVGHALYEHHLPRDWEGTPFQEALSLSVHESQSRFWENVIARSPEFCEFLHPVLKKRFPKSMKNVGPEELFLKFNRSAPNLIRVEASELYYNLHIIVRFEIEELVFNQGLNAKDIPEIWAQKYQEYLGLVPANHAEGVLQDSHWAGAAFGYFPTYTLGNLISGSLYQQLKTELPGFMQQVRTGDFKQILGFLTKKIHAKGRSITLKNIVGELEVDDYLSYLREKFKG